MTFWQLSGLLFFIWAIVVIIQERKKGGFVMGKNVVTGLIAGAVASLIVMPVVVKVTG